MSSSATPTDFRISADDLVAGARIDVIGALQHEAFDAAALRAHQIFDRRNRLVVRHRAAVEDVVGGFFALVFQRIEQEAVEFLEHRQHRLAADRSPAAEHRGDVVLADEFARLLGEQRPVGGGVDHDRLDLLAEQAAAGVDLGHLHQHQILQDRLADRHRSREGMQDADLDRVFSPSLWRAEARQDQKRGGGEPGTPCDAHE